ncbi:MAG: integrase core domain-containing protein, partial [Actinomycetes bacterium]
MLKSVDDAVADGFCHAWACSLWRVADDRVHRWRARQRDVGTLVDRAPGGNPMHGILPAEIEAILAVAEQWGPVDRSHRKLAHRGSYLGRVYVSPSTVDRVLAAHGLVLPGRQRPAPRVRKPWPAWVEYRPNQVWGYDFTAFPAAGTSALAILDLVSRYWIDTMLCPEATHVQVQALFTRALEREGLLDEILALADDLADAADRRPVLLTVSD